MSIWRCGRVDRRRVAPTLAATFVVAALLVVTVSACGDDDNADAEAASQAVSGASVVDTSWVLDSYVVSSDSIDAAATATLEFGADGKTLNGSTGCNAFAGKYSQEGDDLEIELGPVTLAACLDDDASDQQEALLELLPQVSSFTLEDNLTLLDDTGSTLLVYRRGIAGLSGTAWTATGVNNGKGAVESTALTETITAEFAGDGTLSGFSGCNTYNATYETSGSNALTISNISSTMKACDDAAMTLEGQYVAALGNVTAYEISGASLKLRDANGATQATYAGTVTP